MSTIGSAADSFGAHCLGDGRTRFRLWAPGVDSLQLEFGDGRRLPMQRGEAGWFENCVRCAPGTAYRYRLPDGLAVPDPASRAQLDDVHGFSLVVDPHAYAWRHPHWRGRPWAETVLYELHVGLCGGFSGVTRELPALAAMGITAVELMPIADFPGRRNWGYDGVLPFAPAQAYGTPEELKTLVDTAHGLGLMVFLDVIYNHFGPDGNYLGTYAPDFFREDLPTPWGPAIDFRRPQVRAFFTANARYWLEEYRFDGLRFDAVHEIRDPDWLEQTARALRDALEPDRAVHLVLENFDNGAHLLRVGPGPGYDAQWNDDAHHVLHVLLTGETDGYYAAYAQDPAGQLARCLAEGFAYQGETDPVVGRPRGRPSGALPPQAFVLFLQNHDQVGNRAMGDRLSTLCSPRALLAARTLQLLCPMIPLLFMGEPWDATEPFLFFTDHHGELAAQVREGRRREFEHFPAFGDAQQRARIPDPNAVQTYLDSHCTLAPGDARAIAQAEPLRRLLALRAQHIVPGVDGCRSLGARTLGSRGVLARWRLGNGRELSLASNLGGETLALETPPGTLIHCSDASVGPDAGRLPALCTGAWLT